MPTETEESALIKRKRRLGEAEISLEAANLACSSVTDKDDHDACIFDVLATQDVDMAGSW